MIELSRSQPRNVEKCEFLGNIYGDGFNFFIFNGAGHIKKAFRSVQNQTLSMGGNYARIIDKSTYWFSASVLAAAYKCPAGKGKSLVKDTTLDEFSLSD